MFIIFFHHQSEEIYWLYLYFQWLKIKSKRTKIPPTNTKKIFIIIIWAEWLSGLQTLSHRPVMSLLPTDSTRPTFWEAFQICVLQNTQKMLKRCFLSLFIFQYPKSQLANTKPVFLKPWTLKATPKDITHALHCIHSWCGLVTHTTIIQPISDCIEVEPDVDMMGGIRACPSYVSLYPVMFVIDSGEFEAN